MKPYKMLMLIFGILLVLPMINGAMCVETIANAYISCGSNNINCEFGAGDDIENVSVIFTSQITTANQVPVSVFMYRDNLLTNRIGGQIDIISIKQGNENTATVNCKGNNALLCRNLKAVGKSGDYFMKAIIDPNGINFEVNRTIQFKKTLNLLLSCPLEGFINRAITCSWKVRDSDQTDTLVTGYKQIVTITQGSRTISPTGLAEGEVTFSTDITGSVDVEVTASEQTYLTGIEKSKIELVHPTNTQTLLIDSTDFFDITGGIQSGIHQLVMSVEKGGSSIPIDSIDAVIINPAGLETPLTFTKVDSNTLKTQFNFLQQGTSYTYRGTIFFEDPTEDSLGFEYAIVTAGDVTTPYRGSLTVIIIAIIAGLIVIIVVLFIISRLVRRKKK